MSEPSPAAAAVVVTTYDQANFLAEALQSLSAQTVPACEIVVVDDGSHDDPAAVAAGFAGVRTLRQDNAGLAAARNAGLAAVESEYVIFLDADDRLLPEAIEHGLACHHAHPGCGFVYGAYRVVDAGWRPLAGPRFNPPGPDPHRALLGGNRIGMCGAVMFDRAMLAAAGGFDERLARCEDYEAYLRLAAGAPVAAHSHVVAEYRIHDANMSHDPVAMLDGALQALRLHRPRSADGAASKAFRAGRRAFRWNYAKLAWERQSSAGFAATWRKRAAMARRAPFESLLAAAASVLPPAARRSLARRVKRIGKVDLGDLARATPVSGSFGFDRGTPVDRKYIEQFLAAQSADIRGRVLEVGDDYYSRRFGQAIGRQEVLHVDPGHPGATLTGDLATPATLPQAAFDCVVLTQTLHLIYDLRAALNALHGALAPGGVVLATVPGVSSVDRGEWGGGWCWSLTGHAARRLFEEAFAPQDIEVEEFGNVYAATCFLQGLAVEELDPALLEVRDPAYPVIVAIRARRGA